MKTVSIKKFLGHAVLFSTFITSSISLQGCGEALVTAEEAAKLASTAQKIAGAKEAIAASEAAVLEASAAGVTRMRFSVRPTVSLSHAQADRLEVMEKILERAQSRAAAQRVEALGAVAAVGGSGFIGYEIAQHDAESRLAECSLAVDKWREALITPNSNVEQAEQAAILACHSHKD